MKIVKLKDVAMITTGKTPSKSDDRYYLGGTVPFVKPPNLKGSDEIIATAEYVTEDGAKKANIIPKHSIMVSCIGSLGKVGIAGTSLVTNQQINSLTFDDQIVDYKYGYYFALTLETKLKQIANSAVVPIVNKTTFSNLDFPLLSLNEQKQIIKSFNQNDFLRQKRKQAIELLDGYIRSIFLEMFGDPARNSKDFTIKPLAEILRLPTQNGLYVPKEDYSVTGVEMVHMSDAFKGIVNRGSLKRVSISQKTTNKYSITSDDILIARRSLTYDGSAKPCRIPQSSEPLVFESSLIKVSVDKNKILPVYLYYYLNNPVVRNSYVLKHVTSSTISGINQSGLNKINVIVPPLELQSKFSEIVYKTESLKQKMLLQSQQLDTQFQTLMQKSFNKVS